MATGLNNLAGLLYATNRPAEAEPLCWRALAIHEKSSVFTSANLKGSRLGFDRLIGVI